MNKKLNTALFILLATLIDIIICFVLIVVLLLAVIYFFKEDKIREYLITGSFIAAIAASSILYRRIANWAFEKFNLEDKLDPIVRPRTKNR